MKRLPFLILLVAAVPAVAADYAFEALGGAPAHLSSSLTVRQDGRPDLEMEGGFRSEPFTAPPYYVLRASRRTGGAAWALELLHHKVILDDPTPEVPAFSVTHGYNVVSVLHLRSWRGFDVGGGAGIVAAHPESTVRGLTLDEDEGVWGYHLVGPAFTLVAGRRVPLNDRFFLTGEGRLTVTWADVPVAEGEADFSALIAQLHFGVGVRF